MVATLLLTAALAILPHAEPVRESVDLIETNHFYDEQGRLVFDQTIFYDWDRSADRYQVRAWRLVKHPSQLPQRDWRTGRYVATWIDSKDGSECLRRVESEAIKETWSQHDPELAEREYLPKERRRELRTVKARRASP